MSLTNRLSRLADRRNPAVPVPKFIYEASFDKKDAEARYGELPQLDQKQISQTYMADEITRDLARRMHYAGWRVSKARRHAEADKWASQYYWLRDQIILGNRKLIYRAVRRRMAQSNRVDDLIGDCHIVLIQAVAAYNPWLGIRFSTYAFTCLVRALSRLAQKLSKDWLSRMIPLDSLPDVDPASTTDTINASMPRVEDFLREDHPLLSAREKAIIGRRFNLTAHAGGQTLENVGRALGLSKERVRQVQATALGKLRYALLGEPVPASA